jgi:hypothetical protein
MKAFPTHSISVSDEARVTAIGGEGGMDLRDYFAAMAMQGVLAHQTEDYAFDDAEEIAVYAYHVANEMMKQKASHD